MGLVSTVYLGPMAVCKVQRITSTEQRTACGKQGCTGYGVPTRNAFCPACGSAIGHVPLHFPITSDSVNHWEVCERFKEAMVVPGGDDILTLMEQNGEHYWIPNARREEQAMGQRIHPREESAVRLLCWADAVVEKV